MAGDDFSIADVHKAEAPRSFDAAAGLVLEEIGKILRDKGETDAGIGPESRFLNGEMPLDSLDLATLIVVLEERTGKDPFREGYRSFSTVAELAELYA